MTRTLYCAKLLIDGTGKPPIEDAAICTEGDRILSVGKRQTSAAISTAGRSISGRRRFCRA